MRWYPTKEDMETKDGEGRTLRQFLGEYNPRAYELPAVTVDILLFLKQQPPKLLLVRRGRHPSYGMLALPGGFIDLNEELENSAARELLEETGIQGIQLTQLGAYGAPGRDPRMRIVSVAYLAVVDQEPDCAAGDDAADAAFYSVRLKSAIHCDNTIYSLAVENDDSSATAIIEATGSKKVILQSQIASDHSIMILDALERLGLLDN